MIRPRASCACLFVFCPPAMFTDPSALQNGCWVAVLASPSAFLCGISAMIRPRASCACLFVFCPPAMFTDPSALQNGCWVAVPVSHNAVLCGISAMIHLPASCACLFVFCPPATFTDPSAFPKWMLGGRACKPQCFPVWHFSHDLPACKLCLFVRALPACYVQRPQCFSKMDVGRPCL